MAPSPAGRPASAALLEPRVVLFLIGGYLTSGPSAAEAFRSPRRVENASTGKTTAWVWRIARKGKPPGASTTKPPALPPKAVRSPEFAALEPHMPPTSNNNVAAIAAAAGGVAVAGNKALPRDPDEPIVMAFTSAITNMLLWQKDSLRRVGDSAVSHLQIAGDAMLGHRSKSCFGEAASSSGRFGCMGACACRWYERCYPAHRAWPEEHRSGAADTSEEANVGECGWTMATMVLVSVLSFLAVAALTIIVRFQVIFSEQSHLEPPRLHIPPEGKVMAKKATAKGKTNFG